MDITVSLDGLDALEGEWRGALDQLETHAAEAALVAARAGVAEAQENHPYTDRTWQLTETAIALPHRFSDGASVDGAAMFWRKLYASFVDEGTRRSRPYPFTPIAIERATASFERGCELAVRLLEDRMSR